MKDKIRNHDFVMGDSQVFIKDIYNELDKIIKELDKINKRIDELG